MRKLSTILLVAAAAATVTLTTGGSAYAGGTPAAPAVTPASSNSVPNMDDEMTMGGCHRAHKAAEDSNPVNG